MVNFAFWAIKFIIVCLKVSSAGIKFWLYLVIFSLRHRTCLSWMNVYVERNEWIVIDVIVIFGFCEKYHFKSCGLGIFGGLI